MDKYLIYIISSGLENEFLAQRFYSDYLISKFYSFLYSLSKFEILLILHLGLYIVYHSNFYI